MNPPEMMAEAPEPADMQFDDSQIGDAPEIYLPDGVAAEAKAGEPYEGMIRGTIIERDGKRYVQVEEIEGQPVVEVSDEPAEETSEDIGNKLTAAIRKQAGAQTDDA